MPRPRELARLVAAPGQRTRYSPKQLSGVHDALFEQFLSRAALAGKVFLAA
jgi:hypothetical protein